VEDMIEFVVGDFFRLAPALKVQYACSVLHDEHDCKRHTLCLHSRNYCETGHLSISHL
jgi:hypothetical protein